MKICILLHKTYYLSISNLLHDTCQYFLLSLHYCIRRDGDGMCREVGFGKLDWIHGLLELDSWNRMGMDGLSRLRAKLKLNTEYKIVK